MNNKKKNNKNNDKRSCIIGFIVSLLISVYLFASYTDLTGYGMNPLGYLFCITPLVCGLILLFYV